DYLYRDARKELLQYLDPDLESLHHDYSGEAYIIMIAKTHSKCQIELYGLLNIVKDRLLVLSDEEVLEVIDFLLDIDTADKFLVKRFVDPKRDIVHNKPFIGQGNVGIRRESNFILSAIAGGDAEFYKHRVFQLWLRNLLDFDVRARNYIEEKKIDIIETYKDYEKSVLLQAFRLYKWNKLKERLLTLLQAEYASKKYFSAYTSDIIHLLNAREELFADLSSKPYHLPLEQRIYNLDHICRELGVVMIESILNYLAKQIPEPTGFSKIQARMILNKRINNMKKYVLTEELREEILSIVCKLYQNLGQEDEEQAIDEIIRIPYNRLAPRGEYYFEKIEAEVKAFLQETGDRDLRKELSLATDDPQTLVKQYGRQAFDIVGQKYDLKELYSTILALKGTEITFSGTTLTALKRQQINQSFVNDIFSPKFDFLKMLSKEEVPSEEEEEASGAHLSNMEEKLKLEYGEKGVEYLFPQLEIIRATRNMPSRIEDVKLFTQRFFESYQMVQQWLAPVIVPISEELSELRTQLHDLQDQMKYYIQQEGIEFWKDVENSENLTIQSFYSEIVRLRNYILAQQEKLLGAAHRKEIAELLGLVIWPYSEHVQLPNAIQEAKNVYFGENAFFRKNNMLTDALILLALCEDLLKAKKQTKQSLRQVEGVVEKQLSFRNYDERLQWEQYKRDPNEGMFTEGQVKAISKALLPNMSSSEMYKGINQFYDSVQDKYPINRTLEWLAVSLRKEAQKGEEAKAEPSAAQSHIISLSFMDKHRRHEILGNIGGLENIFERVLGPFHELKQENAFMQSAQFELENVAGLPSQAWIYDYTGIETEILRSTLLLISERQPKFDVLEACQRLANIVLSGRVDRNDFRRGNYILTNRLPSRIWNYIGNSLLAMLEEALIQEESTSVSLIKGIFREEDRSKLVTSKKFIPIFLVQTDFKEEGRFQKRRIDPETMSIWAHETLNFQYRFAQLSGYPWFYEVNELLESLVIEALSVPTHHISRLHENVKLRQTVFTVDNETFIIYFKASKHLKTIEKDEGPSYGRILEPETVEMKRVSALAFKEVDITNKEGIDPVEVIFRPHKFLDRGPEKNNLKLILEEARASDPKDLRTIISNL
ncbi:MAG: hypothetical protein ACFFBD_11515, partial [Candidatus Hodarchaeota archaeon]